jgi:hypothetical protein
MNFNFTKYHPAFMEHIKRHFAKGGTVGSIFTGNRFRTPRDVVDYAYEIVISTYRGDLRTYQRRFDEVIGLEGIIAIKDLPAHTAFKRETRERKRETIIKRRSTSYSVWIAYGIKRKPTKNIVIIAGPLPQNPSIHTFLSIYPGMYAPDFEDVEFWQKYAFINERKLHKR